MSRRTPSAGTRLLKGVVIASPGGRRRGGGIGSVTRVISAWLGSSVQGAPVFVIDSRGETVAALWPFFFVYAVMRVIFLRLTTGANILHLQVSERASFLRKGSMLLIGRALGMRTVLHHHGAELIPFFRNSRSWMRGWVKRVVMSADMNIVLGARWHKLLTEEIGVPDEQVSIFYNATTDAGAGTHRLYRKDQPASLLLMANLSPRKGVTEFLTMVQMLRSEGVEVTATLAGGGDVARYKKEAEAFGVSHCCRFTGWVDRKAVEELLSDADMLVVPSFEEGLPMVILEALSAGLPVIATPVGSIPEVLADGEDCLLVPPGDVDALAAAVRRIIRDEDALVDRLTSNGRRLYAEKFEIGAYMRALIGLYERVLASPADRRHSRRANTERGGAHIGSVRGDAS